MQIGDRIKVIDQEIYGKIMVDHGKETVEIAVPFFVNALK